MGLLSEVRFKFTARQTGAVVDVAPQYEPSIEEVIGFADGILADQANRLVIADVELAASGNEDVDLAGTLEDVFGASVVFAKLVALIVIAAAGNTNNVRVGLGTNPFLPGLGGTTPTYDVMPGGLDVKVAPALAGLGTIVGGTNDILRFANSGAGSVVNYRRILLGRAAS